MTKWLSPADSVKPEGQMHRAVLVTQKGQNNKMVVLLCIWHTKFFLFYSQNTLKFYLFLCFYWESSRKNHNTFLLKAAVMQIKGVLKSQRFNTLSCSVLEFIFGV